MVKIYISKGCNHGEPSFLLDIPKGNSTKNLQELIDFCFPDCIFDAPLTNSNIICNTAILCPTNQEVEMINVGALAKMRGDSIKYSSIDVPLAQETTFDTFRSDNNLEFIHNEMPSGFPPHILELKVCF